MSCRWRNEDLNAAEWKRASLDCSRKRVLGARAAKRQKRRRKGFPFQHGEDESSGGTSPLIRGHLKLYHLHPSFLPVPLCGSCAIWPVANPSHLASALALTFRLSLLYFLLS
eukprot:6199560-Pleurochrysis_carterae.AAC.1